ncbi:hypothetical protein GCM10023169_20780 [Georgenia halophila]|uniref:Uncharacterized protein n=1 Tax=Georgenia halophila TaxID=620889 RepID=A0ABP8L7E3_9MICO
MDTITCPATSSGVICAAIAVAESTSWGVGPQGLAKSAGSVGVGAGLGVGDRDGAALASPVPVPVPVPVADGVAEGSAVGPGTDGVHAASVVAASVASASGRSRRVIA